MTLDKTVKTDAGELFYLDVAEDYIADGVFSVVFCGYDLNGDEHFSAPAEITVADYQAENFELRAIVPQLWKDRPAMPEPDIRYLGIPLDPGSKYFEITYANNTAPGTAAVTVVTTLTEPALTLSETFEIVEGKTFGDMPEGHWACEAAGYAAAAGLIGEAGDGLFAPDEALTRAAAAKLFAAMGGEALPEAGDEPLTREELAGLFYQYALKENYNVSDRAVLDDFADSGEISGDYADAVSSCVGLSQNRFFCFETAPS